MNLECSRKRTPRHHRAGRLFVAAIALLIGCSDNGPITGPVAQGPAHAPDAAPPPLGTTGGPTANTLQPSPPPPIDASLAPGVRIREIDVFQGTKTPIAKDGQRVPTLSRKLPVIAGRDALVRVYVDAAAPSRTLTGEFYIQRGGALQVVRETATIAGPSRDEDRDSTFDFELPAALVQPDAHYLVRIIDPAAPPVPTTTSNPAQYPPMRALETFEALPAAKLRVVILPTQYTADGSNRMPDLSPPMLDKIKKRLLEFFPVSEVELTMHQPISWAKPLQTYAAWEEYLNAVIQLRLTENAPFDAYYYGAVAPAPSPEAFCPASTAAASCLTGLAAGYTEASDVGVRAAVGALYDTEVDLDTVTHEIGHAHGQAHAPCEAGNPDPSYPYAGGVTGVWGYSIITKELKPPTLADQMGYCTPRWQSDYVYGVFFQQARRLANMRVIKGKPRTYRMVKLAPGGGFEWTGEAFTSTAVLSGVAQPIQWVDGAGQVVGSDNAHGYAYSEGSGGYMIVPVDAVPHATHVRFDISQRASDALTPLRQHVGERVQLRR